MKLKKGYVLKEVAGMNIVVNVTGKADLNGMLTLNDSAAFLWQYLENEINIENLTETLVSEYNTDLATAEKDISLFITKLEDAGILE